MHPGSEASTWQNRVICAAGSVINKHRSRIAMDQQGTGSTSVPKLRPQVTEPKPCTNAPHQASPLPRHAQTRPVFARRQPCFQTTYGRQPALRSLTAHKPEAPTTNGLCAVADYCEHFRHQVSFFPSGELTLSLASITNHSTNLYLGTGSDGSGALPLPSPIPMDSSGVPVVSLLSSRPLPHIHKPPFCSRTTKKPFPYPSRSSTKSSVTSTPMNSLSKVALWFQNPGHPAAESTSSVV